MHRKIFYLFIALIALAVSIGNSSAAMAQPPQPDMPGQRSTNQPAYTSREMSAQDDDDLLISHPLGGSALPLQPTNPEINLGQPGFSLRYVQTFGMTEEPYPADGQHFNGPSGMAIDSSNNLYVVEEFGYRMLKMNTIGANLMTVGHAGQPWHHDDFLSYPKDVAVDGSGNLWILISSAVKKFDSSGTLLMIFPELDPWSTGADNDHFNDPRGIALSPSGQLFVSDTYNHRIQVFDVSGDTISYSETIGLTGSPQSDNSGFNEPAQIAFDSLGRLYVVDTANYRVQRCTKSGTWSCSTFFGETGVGGSNLSHLGWAFGIGITPGDQVFIADGDNFRVLKCNTSGTCSHFAGTTGSRGTANSQFWWPADVAVDTSGNVYVSDWDNHRIQKFNSSGTFLATFGVTRTPYAVDSARLNTPGGVAVATDGSIVISELRGFRLVKLNKQGAQQWTVGQPGVYGNDNSHFGDWWAGPEGSPAVDAGGNVYIPDSPNNRIQIFNSNGQYQATFGSYGDGDYQFDFPTGVAISPVNGDIYVADLVNQRIQIYTSGRTYKASLGVLDEIGLDNSHFNYPIGVSVDKNGNIYVADIDNHRVQVFNSNRVYQRTLGITGDCGSDFAHLCAPSSAVADASGRVFVADPNNDRVQVFDKNGAYLTTIAHWWGGNNGQLRGPHNLALDASGSLYVADRENHRIQKFVPGVPIWGQVNINGFGQRENSIVTTLQAFQDQLYAGTYNDAGNGAQLWQYNGSAWSAVMQNGFGDATNLGVDHLYVFNGNLYAGTWNEDPNAPDGTTGGQIWRSANGTSWSRIDMPGLDASNGEVFGFFEFKGQIYAGTWSYTDDHGNEIWRSSTGDSGSWTQAVADGFNGDKNNIGISAFGSFNNQIYAAAYNYVTGGEIWRSANGDSGSWTQINLDGFGDPANVGISSLVEYKGYLYAGLMHSYGAGAQIWRCQVCNGADWSKVVDNGFGNPQTRIYNSMIVHKTDLYSIIGNSITGMEVWRSPDGLNWQQTGFAGFGDSLNRGGYWTNSTAIFRDMLYTGTNNGGHGGEVWLYADKNIFLPLVERN